jgi:nucleoside 2-deoxyribosyltransferase
VKKYQIFVSSTYKDLVDERNEIIKACLIMGNIPVGMEMFNAADEEQWQVITRTIDQCDYYVVIIAQRYGSTVDGVSFTEKEYDYAIAKGVPVLGFVIQDGARWPNDRIDMDPDNVEALRRFKAKVQQRIVRFWQGKAELQAHFAMSLNMTINLKPRPGWVRAPEETDVDIAQAISNLAEENARLRKELTNMQSTSNQMGEAETILAALAQLGLRRTLQDGSDELVGSNKLFVTAVTALHRKAPLETLFPDFDKRDVKELHRNLFMMGLIEPLRTGAWKLTPLGGIVYARLIAEPEN